MTIKLEQFKLILDIILEENRRIKKYFITIEYSLYKINQPDIHMWLM